ncbi:hypothetical protein [Streptomyces apocyni]|uniref:hypothetical protein n=1 Tax=Streptomyces apocyni TaxID=2654677 RepID=UPI0012EACDA6|nr:hypothetical protein [Streptomyces apocyni]
MSGKDAVDPAEIPRFTGNLAQLEQNIKQLAGSATAMRDAGTGVDKTFGGLSAYYQAPEAEQLFAATAPVAATGEDFHDELQTISKALATYASEIRPLIAKLEELRRQAAAFRASIADDAHWKDDGGKTDENNRRLNEVTATWNAFTAAERACHSKIVTLVGGTPLTVNDGSEREGMYGFRAEDLAGAKGLPWGDPVQESIRGWEIHRYIKRAVWDGFIMDGVVGTFKGLGTLVGTDGWDAAGEAWKGLGKLGTGLAITLTPGLGAAYLTAPDDKLPSWLRESRTAMKETGKAMVAWDQWGTNPARAAGATTFNVLTTVFTGGVGTGASAAGKASMAAKALSAANKASRIVDPTTYIIKGASAGMVKISDVMASLKGVTNGTYVELANTSYRIAENSARAEKLPEGVTPENSVRMETPEGKVVYYNVETRKIHHTDGTISSAVIPHEPSAATRAAAPDRQLVGAQVGGDAAGVARGGDGLPGRLTNNVRGGALDDNLPGGRGPTASHGLSGGSAPDTLPGRANGPGGGGLGRTGDDAGRTSGNLPGASTDDLTRGPSANQEPPVGPRGDSDGTVGPHSDSPGDYGDGANSGSHGGPTGANGGTGSADGHAPGQHGGTVRPPDNGSVRSYMKSEEWAEEAYDAIRTTDDATAMAEHLGDVPRIDGGRGFSRAEIEEIKHHVFNAEHPLATVDGGIVHARYDPNPDMAEAWIRLRSGRHTESDLLLLEHELAEHRYYQAHPGSTYAEAHAAATEVADWSSVRTPPARENYAWE